MNIEFCEREQSFCFLVDVINIIIEDFVFAFIEILNIDLFQKKQSLSFCFVDIIVSISVERVLSEHNDFYERKQFCFSVDDIVNIDDIVAVVVMNIDAFTLIVDMIKKKKFT